jgi:hypothetical protein
MLIDRYDPLNLFERIPRLGMQMDPLLAQVAATHGAAPAGRCECSPELSGDARFGAPRDAIGRSNGVIDVRTGHTLLPPCTPAQRKRRARRHPCWSRVRGLGVARAVPVDSAGREHGRATGAAAVRGAV